MAIRIVSCKNLIEAYARATVASMGDDTPITIHRASEEHEFRAVAEIMGTSEPWISLGRTPEKIYPNLIHPQLEIYVAVAEETVVGGINLAISVPLIKGYVAGLAVAKDWRNRGIGGRLLRFGEERIFRDSPNVFLCVTTFNTDAQRFYSRMGYERIGEIKDYTVRGSGEIFMRKTTGPWAEFEPAK